MHSTWTHFAERFPGGSLLARSAYDWLKGKGVRWNNAEHTWEFPSDATLTFGYLDNETTSIATKLRVSVHRLR